MFSMFLILQILCQLDVIYYLIHKLMFVYNFKTQKINFKHFIDEIVIDL